MQSNLLGPGEDDVFLQQVCVVQVFEDDGNTRQQLDLVQLHHTLKSSQQILLGFFVVVAELRRNENRRSVRRIPDVLKTRTSSGVKSDLQEGKVTQRRDQIGTYSQEVPLVLLDVVADVFVKEQLAEDQGAHGLHIQTLRLRQDLLISRVDGSTLLLVLQRHK